MTTSPKGIDDWLNEIAQGNKKKEKDDENTISGPLFLRLDNYNMPRQGRGETRRTIV